MKVLFDQGTPVPLRRYLRSHEVTTVYELSWSTLQNGALLSQAEAIGFDVLITTDKNLKYQQNLSARRLAIVVLLSTSWPKIQQKGRESIRSTIFHPSLPWISASIRLTRSRRVPVTSTTSISSPNEPSRKISFSF